MKNLHALLLGMLLPIIPFVYLATIKSETYNPLAQTLGVKVEIGDPNVNNFKYSEFYEAQVKDALKHIQGNYSIYIKNLKTQEYISLGEKNDYYAASLFKIPVAIETLKEIQNGAFSLEDEIEYMPQHFYPGSGRIQESQYGTKFTVDQLLVKLIKDSDNVAQSMLMSKLSEENVYSLMPSPISLRASQMVFLLEDLSNGKYLDEFHTDYLLGLMAKTSFDDRINAGLVKGITFSHKIGNWGTTGSWHDCGLVRGNNVLAVCVMSDYTTYEDFLEVTESVGKVVSKLAN